jgi:hypothetical protein
MTLRHRLDLILFLGLLLGFLAMFLSPGDSRPPRHEEVDLLSLIRTDGHAVAGTWTREGATLVTPSIAWGRLQVPYVPPEEYDLKLTVQRTRGLDSLNLGLSTGRRQFMVIVDGDTGSASWIDRIEAKAAGSGVSRRAGKIFVAPNAPVELELAVRRNGVSLTAAGRTILDWKGSPGSATVFDAWTVPDPKALFVGSFETEYRIERMTLLPRSGDGRRLR